MSSELPVGSDTVSDSTATGSHSPGSGQPTAPEVPVPSGATPAVGEASTSAAGTPHSPAAVETASGSFASAAVGDVPRRSTLPVDPLSDLHRTEGRVMKDDATVVITQTEYRILLRKGHALEYLLSLPINPSWRAHAEYITSTDNIGD